MNVLLETVASNCLVAAALAAVVAIVAKCRTNPTLVHFLLLLVLIKLFTPPLVSVGIPESVQLRADEPVETVFVGHEASAPAGTTVEPQGLQSILEYWQALVLIAWAAGIVVILGTTVFRIIAFQILLRRAGQAPEFLSRITNNLCRKMGVRNVPEVLLLPIRITPAVWSLTGRPRIIFPQKLIAEMSSERLETIMAHELAHIRRKDHLVRFLEFAATTVFWWNPVVWWVRRQMRELEERCCDAIVLETVTDGARDYAIALVETLEFLSQDHGRLPIGATAAKPAVCLSRRIEMLETGRNVRRLTARGVITAACFLAVPMSITLANDPLSSELKTKLYHLGSLKSEAKHVEQQILNEVGLKQWKRSGGPFTIRRTADGNLVVNATAAVHKQITGVIFLHVLERLERKSSKKSASIEHSPADVTRRVYPVGDLVIPIERPRGGAQGGSGVGRRKWRSLDLSGGGFGNPGFGGSGSRPIPAVIIPQKDVNGRDLRLRLLPRVDGRFRIKAEWVGDSDIDIIILRESQGSTDNNENEEEETDESR